MDLNDFEPDLLSPLPGASVLKKTKKKLTRTDYSVLLPAIKTVGFLKTIVPSWPSVVAVLLTAQTTYAVTCQPYHHDNQGYHSNKRSYNIK